MNIEHALIAQIISKLSPATVTVIETYAKPWASVTFSGARHEIALLVEGSEALHVSEGLKATMKCEEFDIKGHLVADILINHLSADQFGVRLDIEALTVMLD